MSLGGPNGVRAYPVGEANGDTGLQMTGEARYIIPGFRLLEATSRSAFYDWGQIYINEKPRDIDVPNKRSIAGAGFGLSLGKEGDFVFRGSASWSADDEQPQADTAHRVPRVWVQAVKWF